MTQASDPHSMLRFALPKGRMQEGVFKLMADAGIHIRLGSRSYRPSLSLPECDAKILKPQNVIEMLHIGSRDIGFAGADWVEELGADLVELLDTGLDPVSLVAAAPAEIVKNGGLSKGDLLVASEYQHLTRKWIEKKKLNATLVRSYGATEVFPPEDADLIVDNTATGSTLKVNRLEIVDVLMTSSTRLYANPASLKIPERKELIEHITMLLNSVIEARKRVMLEVNISADGLEALVALLPCMRKPTVSHLYQTDEYAVKSAVPRKGLPELIAQIKATGGTDIVVTAPDQLVA